MTMKNCLTFLVVAAIIAGAAYFFFPEHCPFKQFEFIPPALNVKADVSPLKPVSLSLFKNGYALVQLKATLPEGTRPRIENLPVPSLGTFWVSSDSVVINRISCDLETQKYPTESVDFVSLALANIDAAVKIRTSEGNFYGRIVNIKLPETVPPNPNVMEIPSKIDTPNPELLILASSKGVQAIHFKAIQSMEFTEKTPNFPMTEKKVPVMTLDLGHDGKDKSVYVGCLAQGISWLPSYHFNITDSEKLIFESKATIINELMDMQDVSLELITGFPHMKFATIQSPVAMRQTLFKFFESLTALENSGSPYGANLAGKALMLNQAMYSDGLSRTRSAENALAFNPAEGTTAEDLFFYPLKNMTLKRGETVTKALFRNEFPYKHIYTWAPTSKMPDYNYGRPQPSETAPEVWHCIRFTNSGNVPLTTAAATFYSSGKLVGQDQCNFTAPGEDATIKINRAVNVLADQKETEVRRESIKIGDNSYTKIIAQGILSIKNTSQTPFEFEITKTLTGTMVSATDSPLINQTLEVNYWDGRLNPQTVMKWRFTLPPNATIERKYDFYIIK